ncbi:YheC/YheD family endospore coat-associated protein [Longirhabdus pacifica]|uniref:YheC/YheD family endospore coat-associated protein n=1 Tax=Longirhabdus pacifica TaxID=2305227 RepID=UPI0010088C4F|nr:YheC/YheD family protein [Longirhabdus pacifica]
MEKHVGITISSSDPQSFQHNVFLRYLCLLGKKLRLIVYVFSVQSIQHHTVVGYTYSQKENNWVKSTFPTPDFIFDRCFTHSMKKKEAQQRFITELCNIKPVLILNRSVCSKWHMYQLLNKYKCFQPYLPETKHVENIPMILDWLEQHDHAFMKPHMGSHGKQTIAITKRDEEVYDVQCRDEDNRAASHTFHTNASLCEWLTPWIGNEKYIIQPFLSLKDAQNRAYDIRALVQKNKNGKWDVTGITVRRGYTGSITSNLHGGAASIAPMPFLQSLYSKKEAQHLLKQIHQLALAIPKPLERHFGHQIEFGIDTGLDKNGNLWLLEVNSKPGRNAFKAFPLIYNHAMGNPVRYIRYLVESQLGG